MRIEPLDTTLTAWRIDYPFYRNGVGDAPIGALGQGSVPLNYFERPQWQDFSFASPFHSYIYDMRNAPFYNGKRPFLQMTYIESGQKRYRETNFEIRHAQNISPSTSFSIDYKSRGTRGLYEWSRTKNQNIAVTVAHTGKRYSVHAGYVNNHIETQENGGVVGEWAIRDTVFEMPSGVPMRLTNAKAENIYRNHAFFLTQSYAIPLQRVTENDFSLADLSAVFIGHSIEYDIWSKTYTDIFGTYTDERGSKDENGNFVATEGHEYYDNWFIHPDASRDTLCERRLSNRLFVQAQPWDRNGVIGTIDGGVGFDIHTYSQFALGDYITGKYRRTRKTSYFAYGSIAGKIKKYVDWDANMKVYPSGYRGGDMSLGAHLALKGYLRGHALILEGRFSNEKRSPGYWQENLFSNHYVWSNSLAKENETRIEASFRVPDYALELAAWQDLLRPRRSRRLQRRRPATRRQRQPDEFVCPQGFPHRRTPSGQQGIVAVEYKSGGHTRSARERLPLVLLRVLGSARRVEAANRSRRPLQHEVLRPGLQSGPVGVLQPARNRGGELSLHRRFRHGQVETNAHLSEISACQQGAVRQRRLLFRGPLPAQPRHVQDGYFVGILRLIDRCTVRHAESCPQRKTLC